MNTPLQVLNCDGCGACCTACPLPPFSLSVMLSAPMFIRRMVADAIVTAAPGGPCVAYDAASKRCTIYADRPIDCRDFRVGGPACLAARADARIE